jgi:hypothetical protein
MKNLLTSAILAAGLFPARAQDQGYVHALQVELPQLELKYSVPVKEKGISTLAYGMNQFFRSPESGISAVALNFTFRPISFFYKDKIGLAFYYNGFGSYLGVNDFNRYMVAKYGSKYDYLPNTDFNTLAFYGPAIGIAYRLHYGSYIIEPNFIFGFEHLDGGNLDFEEVMKQYGSNQFVDYQLGVSNASPAQHSYRPRLSVGRRYHFKKISTVFEFDLVVDYIYSPYAYNLTISQISYGYLPTVEQLAVRSVYRQYNFGVYLKANLHRPLN